MFKHTILLALISLIISCNSNKSTYIQKVQSPIPEHDIFFSTFIVDADSSVSIHMQTGTQIQFQASSFETASGKPISGKIDIKVREFHTANELLRAGIPLTVDETRKEVLQSAGMIELRAFKDGEELKLKPGRSGDVALAGFRPSEGYSLYQLGDDVRWKVNGFFRSRKNEKKIDSLIKPVETSEDMGFEIAADLKEVPYLIPFKGLRWEPVGGKQNKRQLEEAMRIHWDSVKVLTVDKKRKQFQLVFSKTIYSEKADPEEKKWVVMATPKLNGRSMQQILKEQEKVERLIAQEKKRLDKEADMLNTFRINQMGIWNIDKVMIWPNTQGVSLSFDFVSSLNTDITNIKVFMILDTENSVIPVLQRDWAKLLVPTDRAFHFVAILPGGRVVIADAIQVKKALEARTGELKLITRLAQKQDIGI